jgi:hypothetical protein
MSQETNLNVSPYFDDFDANNDYYKVLFKPGYPVQARELTTLQSVLQNQIEKTGQRLFKEGDKVIPGNISYNRLYYAVEINNTYSGVAVAEYLSQLVGVKITGQTSGVTAVVKEVITQEESDRDNATLYVSYLSSNSADLQSHFFLDNELLITEQNLTSQSTTITSGDFFASTVANNATSTGSSFSISSGVYFVRGYFVNVPEESIILDQYSNTPSYRVGLLVSEEVVNSYTDPTLNDNSNGFNNYAAPGADRLRISVSLYKKALNDFDDNNFIELATITNGVIRTKNKSSESFELEESLAKRTYSETGDYYISPIDVSVKESLSDNIGNRGIYNSTQVTQSGSSPADNLALYQISPGKAFVKGYEVETTKTVFLDAPKPRTTKTLSNQSINYYTGPTFRINRVSGNPVIGIGNTYILSLRDTRVGSDSFSAAGKEIGVARVYDFRLDSEAYDASNTNLNDWNLSLYDIQTTTEITLNEPVTLSTPSFIKGKYSGATAFLKDSVSSGAGITVYQKSGQFLENEPFIINGIENGRIAIAITSYDISDIKSAYGIVGAANTFTADIIQTEKSFIGVATISAASGGISTVTSTNSRFINQVKVGNILQYSSQSLNLPTFVKVVSISSTTVGVSSVQSVPGVCSGDLPVSTLNVSDLRLLTTNLSSSEDDTLYTPLPKKNISSINLQNSTVTIRKTYSFTISGNSSGTLYSGTNETFLPFSEKRYSLIRVDGTTEVLTSDRLNFNSDFTQLQINNLSQNGDAVLVATLSKANPTSKVKLKNRVNSVIVDKSKYQGSGIGSTTLNDGLQYGNYPYGTRVQDEVISLNVPDIIEVHGIYEFAGSSNLNSDPSAPNILLSSINSLTNTTSDIILGEKFIGRTSGAAAICAEIPDSTNIKFVMKNQNNFVEGEVIFFEESNVTATISEISSTSFDVSYNFEYKNGQKSNLYDYGTIIRKLNVAEPNRKLKVYFSNGYYESGDSGDFTTIDSYNGFDYSREIQSIDGIRTTDIIDIRPRVSNYSVTSGASRSPLEFYGRVFNGSGNSAANILASEEETTLGFSFYLGRIDRIYLSKDGKYQIKYGVPSEKPEIPSSIDDLMEIAMVNLPPYLYRVSDTSVSFSVNKRFRFNDVKNLETRIKNLEYYTALSLLESNTYNLFLPDSTGLDRFKSGFFVDNFTSLQSQEDIVEFKNSLDLDNKELRPKHYTTSLDLVAGPVEGIGANSDYGFTNPEGSNIRRTGDLITLSYSDVEWISQNSASRSEVVSPYPVNFWQGSVKLSPASDVWADTIKVETRIISSDEKYTETLRISSRTHNVDSQSGFVPNIWNSWQTHWVGEEYYSRREFIDKTSLTASDWRRSGSRQIFDNDITSTFSDDVISVPSSGNKSSSNLINVDSRETVTIGDKTVGRDLISFIRSRNVSFNGVGLKPLTRIYAFFDSVDVTKYCVPKLLEISMVSGTFQSGETVIGKTNVVGNSPSTNSDSLPSIKFRVAQSNHKSGPFNSPTSTFATNPYTNATLQTTYSSTSTILNVDTLSLSRQTEDFYGHVSTGMVLVGQSSGAQATVTNVRLVSDDSSSLLGSFFIPNPNIVGNPRFETGSKTFVLTSSSTNDLESPTTIAEERFTSSGILETESNSILSTREPRLQNRKNFKPTFTSRVLDTQVANGSPLSPKEQSEFIGWNNPISQSFVVDDEPGIFITKCDLFFGSKDDMNIPILVQIRSMSNGIPTQYVLPFSEVSLLPNQIQTSNDGSVATTVVFDSPVYLEGGSEYSICVSSLSSKYEIYVSRSSEKDLISQTLISPHSYIGNLFKSQNVSTWESSKLESLKFTLYRASFVSSGNVEFYNPILSVGNGQIPKLLPNPLNFTSKKIRIGIGSTLQDTNLTFGNTVLQQTNTGSGRYVGNAGIATGTLGIINAGIGYTPSAGSLTFSDVALTAVTGNGINATANITISNGVAIAATISNSGNGYQVGDVLGITSIGTLNVGRNVRFSLVSIASTNELIIDNVQGTFDVGVAKTVQFINNLGITTYLNSSSGGDVQINSINVINDGLHVKVNHQNHGMYFDDNITTLSNILPDTTPTRLTSAYNTGSTSAIAVENSSEFSTFEGVAVSASNPGYVLIGDEIIRYTSVDSGIISGTITRSIDSTTSRNYPIGSLVYKYEISGISLRRLNRSHDLSKVTISDPISFDSYNIKLDTSSNTGIARSTSSDTLPELYINETKSAGGFDVRSTQNIPFEVINLQVQNITVQGTSLSADLRTISGSSLSGTETAFINQGYQTVPLNKNVYFDSTRIVGSRVNENENLDDLSGNRSLNLRVSLGTVNEKVSPIIDTHRVNALFTTNRVNSVIQNYSTDSRVNGLKTDPSSFQYISKEISLQNPATSIKILVDSYINQYANIRAFYAISNNSEFEPIFVPFPGYSNLNRLGETINESNNDGLSDFYIQPSQSLGFSPNDLDYKEYSFTANSLTSFKSFRIKLVITSTNQVYVPRIRNLKVIALA